MLALHRKFRWVTAAVLCLLTGAAGFAADAPDAVALEASGAHVGVITIKTREIFDLDQPEENRALFRLTNRLHRNTHAEAIRAQLLFASGDRFSQRLLEETERNLREQRFLREPQVRVAAVHDGLVDVEVETHDVWTLQLGPNFSRSGGSNTTALSFEDMNFLGYGKTVKLGASTNIDRKATTAEWRDPNVFGSRWRDNLYWSENSDGQVRRAEVWRPFYALDVRRSYGLELGDGSQLDSRYQLGVRYDQYLHAQHWMNAYVGWSNGLQAGSARRMTLGWRVARDEFAAQPGNTLATVPTDRRLAYPYLRFDWLSGQFQTTRNHDLIARTEDLQLGLNGTLLVGIASTALGADRNAAIVDTALSYGNDMGDHQQFFLSATGDARQERSQWRDLRWSASGAWYWRTSGNSVFHSRLTFTGGSRLDLDHYTELGGDNGLRGYPLRYQTGSGLTLLKIEERYYTHWSLWHLLDIGAAAFIDAGRVHGDNPINAPQLGWLKDVGVGLRLGNSRSSLGNVIHVDLATPLDGERRLDRVQLLVSTEATF